MGVISPAFQVTPDTVPQTAAEFEACLASWEWRIYSGQLYKIMAKTEGADDDDPGIVIPFRPNFAQRDFLDALWYRNLILKARQLGFSTLVAIVWLDHALFNANQRCGMIAQDRETAEALFRDKICFAYDNLPEQLRERFPVAARNKSTLLFAHNNSGIVVKTSLRGGTYQRLHVSEMGKIGAKKPQAAIEIVTGSLPTVPVDGIAVIESTAEGQGGEFYKMSTRAQALHEQGKRLSKGDYRWHFYAWWKNPEYRLDAQHVVISAEEHLYFDEVEIVMGCLIDDEQRAWYIAKREGDLNGDAEMMWREFPSTPTECWQRSTEGKFLARQLATARKEGRIGRFPVVSRVPVHTFWDIGSSAGTAIWLMQYVGQQKRFIGFIEGWDEGYLHFVKALRDTGYLFGQMYLPHDAVQRRQVSDTIASPLSMLQELAPDWRWNIVPMVQTFQHGIDLLRADFSTYYFDEEGCKAGLVHLAEYQKRWNNRLQVWGDEPDKDNPHTEAADALRQCAQGFDPASISMSRRPRRATKGGMAA